MATYIGRALIGRRLRVEDQASIPRAVFPDHRDGLRDGRKLHRDGLDLAQLDTETTQLDLIIRPTDEHQMTVPVPTDDVTRAVHPA
ncbi:hypothetical protein, partial [Streptomyces sp. NEAU-W12]|uniref:hypothetical protein n=1 Tax=Streptomyces sp. NEAU-W12 TaxID=2994668 RepID=UPI00224B9304